MKVVKEMMNSIEQEINTSLSEVDFIINKAYTNSCEPEDSPNKVTLRKIKLQVESARARCTAYVRGCKSGLKFISGE